MNAAGRLVDLHTHSRHSDGTLTPEELVALAAKRGLAVLALTDHDTIAGCAAAASACAAAGIDFIPGVELSCDRHVEHGTGRASRARGRDAP
jgi:3',5'-nucleoside bisphosphate phosphatase